LGVMIEDQNRLVQAHTQYVYNEAKELLEPARGQGSNSVIEDWRLFCMKEKALYATLNLFEGHMNLRASCWYPAAEEEQIKAMLIRQSTQRQGSSSAMLVTDRNMPRKQPPTYIKSNDFTKVFQGLVDTYGLPRYGEANPALFTMVTFPFLFGVMFGDIGHGSMMLCFGIWCVVNAEQHKYLPANFKSVLYDGRYILVMMGFFAVYAGFLYNDLFSIGLVLFPSRWTEAGHEGEAHLFEPAYDIRNEGGPGPYPFGVDPAWHGSQNELIYMNSLKMKISVILGVCQMSVGLMLRFANALYDSNMLDFVCECCPMMVFMLFFFGFMDYMILFKWVTAMDNPPSIINSMIAMGMWQEDDAAMFGMGIVRILMIFTMLTVPMMLLPKPIVLYMQHSKTVSNGGGGGGGGHEGGGHGGGGGQFHGDDEASCLLEEAEGEQFNIGEVVIHQIIETIEYVLGTVSHTASYLRLWALSLAHQQLSVVFFEKTILAGMSNPFPGNVFILFILFALWFGITMAVLMGMDVLECFLHTLRLHWVEFQSKFYKADGYQFVPYCHRDILEERSE